MDTNTVGDIAQTAILAALIKSGWLVGIVYGVGKPYDLIADNGEQLFRVECKSGRLRNGVILAPLYTTSRTGKTCVDTKKVDIVAIHCTDNDKTYLVATRDLETRYEISLRVDPTSNGQSKNIRWARDYEIA